MAALNTADIRSANKQRIVNFILRHPGISQAQLQKQIGLCSQTVNKVLKILEDEQIIARGEALRVMTGAPVPQTVGEKQAMLLAGHIAVWDVIASCEITGSSDASIRNVMPNDLSQILKKAQIREIYTNGAKAHELYQKYIFPPNAILF